MTADHLLSGDVITGARPSSGVTGSEVKVDFTMNAEGAKTWARMTRENVDRCIAVVLDGYVRSYPRVENEITGGSTEITGDFTIDEANDLANILKSGKMPAPARIVSDTVIGPTLGKEAINSGLISFVISFFIVLLYMIFYYSRSAGTIADIALVGNIFLIMGVTASLGAIITLPGIAGIVLTMGMSVDANVLIYERIREELRGRERNQTGCCRWLQGSNVSNSRLKYHNPSDRCRSLYFWNRPYKRICHNSGNRYLDITVLCNLYYPSYL